MNGTSLTLGLVGLAALAGASRRGSRDALRPTSETALILPELDTGLRAVVLVDARLASQARTIDELAAREDCVLGFIRLSYPHDAMGRITTDCDDADTEDGPLEVYNAVARKGWGPLTYDAALWTVADMADVGTQFNGYLVPDRNNVSAAARNVWRYYAEKRKADVESRQIPDSCPKHGYPKPDPVLDRMYRAKMDAPAFKAINVLYERGLTLLGDMEEAFSSLAGRGGRRHPSDREDVEQVFLSLGEKLFGKHF